MLKAPIHQSHIYWQIKILRTIFEKGHSRNIPVKLFQNLTSIFEEDFLRISSCPCSARSPHSPEPCLWTDQNSTNNFWKGSPKEHSCEIISKSDHQFGEEDFLRISSCPYGARSPHSPEPCLWTDQNFANNFEKGHPRNIPVKLFQNLTGSFREEDFLRISSCPYSARSPHSPEPCFWTDQNFVDNFLKELPLEHSCEIISKSDQRFRRRRFFKNFFMSCVPVRPRFRDILATRI